MFVPPVQSLAPPPWLAPDFIVPFADLDTVHWLEQSDESVEEQG